MTMELRVGQLTQGDEFTVDQGETWMTVKTTTVVYSPGATVVLVTTDGGKRWWGTIDEYVIVSPR